MEPFKPLIILFVILFSSVCSSAQIVKYTSTINAAGGSKDISGDNYEWSVGEMVAVNTGVGSNIIVTQGVLQPAPSSLSISTQEYIKDHVSIYPVPSKSTVTLHYSFPNAGKLSFDLTDVAGKILLSNAIDIDATAGTTTINLEHLANANYLLRVRYTSNGGSQSATTFKLNKIN